MKHLIPTGINAKQKISLTRTDYVWVSMGRDGDASLSWRRLNQLRKIQLTRWRHLWLHECPSQSPFYNIYTHMTISTFDLVMCHAISGMCVSFCGFLAKIEFEPSILPYKSNFTLWSKICEMKIRFVCSRHILHK